MNFRLSNLKIDKVLGVDFIDETTNQVVGHWSHLETLPEPEEDILVEVKSDYFPDRENYAALVDTEHGTNWLYFGSDLIHNEAKTIPFEYVSEWRPTVVPYTEKEKKEHKQ